ncbi:MAG: cyclohexanone monooxygenase, partial [Alphaproteobacteria bacterium]
GPHTALGNIPRSIEFNVEWVSDLLAYAQSKGMTRVEATEAAMEKWMDHVMELAKGLLSMEVDSWMTGVNLNVAGKQKRIVARYTGSAPSYRALANDMAAQGYAGITLQ